MQRETFSDLRNRLSGAVDRALRHQAKAEKVALPATIDALSVVRPEHEQLLRQLFEQPPLALVGFDTPGIQRYIFQVKRQVDLMGGSHLIEAFTDPERGTLYKYLDSTAGGSQSVIYAGGGGGLLVVAANEVKTVVDELPQLLTKATAGDLCCIAVALPIWPADLSPAPPPSPDLSGLDSLGGASVAQSRYAATVATLEALKQHERSRRLPLLSSLPTDEYIDSCDACGRTVGRERSYADGEKYRLCPGCKARRDAGKTGKDDDRQAPNFPDLVAGLKNTDLAVLYADGSNVGGAFLEINSMEEHAALSRAVKDAMKRALKEIERSCEWLVESDMKRLQTPLQGGDDLLIVLPAIAAVRILVPLIECYERAFDTEVEGLLTDAFPDAEAPVRQRIRQFGLGVGLAIAHHEFPIQFLFDYAGELLESAKKRIDPGAGARSAVDFLVMRTGSPLSRDLKNLRAKHYWRPAESGSKTLRLSERPYALGELKELLAELDALIHVPPSQIHLIRREIDRGYRQSRSLWRYQHGRADRGSGWQAYRQQLGCDLEEVDSLLWRRIGENAYTTRYLDAFELYDYVVAAKKMDRMQSGEVA